MLVRAISVGLLELLLLLFPILAAGQSSATIPAASAQRPFTIEGHVLAADGRPVIDAEVSIGMMTVHTNPSGTFQVRIARGMYQLRVHAPQSTFRSLTVNVDQDQTLEIRMPVNTSVIVRAGAATDILTADPSTQAYDRKDLIAANPGRPGVPFAVPGFPTETASGEIKAPQYFAPGVAGDHGEAIAQYFNIGGFLFQNNLPANAHGTGSGQPDLLILSRAYQMVATKMIEGKNSASCWNT